MRARWLPLIVGGKWNQELRRTFDEASGVYAIRRKSDRTVEYIGESHTGRGWKTLQRHFQDYSGTFKDRSEYTRPNADGLEAALWVTSSGPRSGKGEGDQAALDLQAKLIAKYGPTENRDDGQAYPLCVHGVPSWRCARRHALPLGEKKKPAKPPRKAKPRAAVTDDDFAFGANVANPPKLVDVPLERRADARTPDLWTGRTKLEEGGKVARRDWKGDAERYARELAECRRGGGVPAHVVSQERPAPVVRPEGYGTTDERGQASMFKRNPGGIMDLDMRDLVGSDIRPPFSTSRGNRAKFQNAAVSGFYRGASKVRLVVWEGAPYESTDEKELSSWVVKALTAYHVFRYGAHGEGGALLPGSTASTADDAVFWLRLVQAMPAIEIPLAARPWVGENNRSGEGGLFGEVTRYDRSGGRATSWVVARTVDETVARRIAILAELTDYAVLLKQLRKGQRHFAEAIKRAEEWTGDPDTRLRWLKLAEWLRLGGGEIESAAASEKAMHAATKARAKDEALERELLRDKRRWPRFAVGDRVTGPLSVFNGETATIESARRGEYERSAPEYSARSDRGVLYAVNEDQGLESAPVTREYVLRLVDRGYAHSLPVASVIGRRRDVADSLVVSGELRKLAARGKFPERFVVTTAGAQAIGAFDSDDRNFREDSREISRKIRASRPPPPTASSSRPAGYGKEETKKKAAGQLRMFNPGAPLSMLGELVSIVYKDASGRRRTLRYGARGAPIVAYAASSGRLVLIFGATVKGASSARGAAEYRKKHWGARGDGERLEGSILAGKAPKLGTALEITYATRKGGDSSPVNYWHTFGDFGALRAKKAFIPPAVLAAKVGGRELVRLEGGSYTVSTHGIVG